LVLARLKVRWSRHIEDKLEKELSRLGITKKLLEEIVSKPDETLFDSENGRNIAVSMKRNLAVIYELGVKDMFIITAIYSSNLERVVQRRKRSGRWL
jgi:hypothetical protein